MYNRQKHNKTYYEKNKENIKRKQREKRARMKEALERLEAEPDEVKTESREPGSMANTFFEHIGKCKRYAIESGHQWVTGCISGYIQSIKEDHREQAEHYAVCASDFLKSVRLTMIINNIANGLNIIKFL